MAQVSVGRSCSREVAADTPRAGVGWSSGSDVSAAAVRASAAGAAAGRCRQTNHRRAWDGAPAGCGGGSAGERGAELRRRCQLGACKLTAAAGFGDEARV